MVATAMAIRSSLLTLPLLLAAACANSARTIDRLWADVEEDARRTTPLADPDASQRQGFAERAQRAREIHAAGGLESAQDYFHAAFVLAESDEPADWALAAELARNAAERGEPGALRIAAEAIDKDLVHQRLPQRYGTQFDWDPTNEVWRLHPIDPATTDAERASMGVPAYAELVAAEISLNARRDSAKRRAARAEDED